ncbi:bifunctional 3-(3-hydroxy-phenyl)propionate/3-hydroxycinnamic acid hydroxylase [Acidovorax sp.]|uniref:bifunctional 3-(3-hydroxy-phenyl)propionate/3-hydroxycinnamic acid hydroxylase MhpA n=1 Tax=Acidovorax sp. TaxID=1872122 RepID=UPI003D042C2E
MKPQSGGHATDVAIVGYGPTGQLLALLLGRMGHRVTVIDRWPDLYPLPRAVHFDHEIGRLLQSAGAAQDVEQILEDAGEYQWRNAHHQVLMAMDWRGLGASGWPVANLFSQPALERVLDSHVKIQPTVDLLQGWSVCGLKQDAEGTELTVEQGGIAGGAWVASGERQVIRARYVIGADGANSFVRSCLGCALHDLGFAFDWLVVDVIPQTPRVWEPKTWQLCDPARPTTVVPGGPGRRRWEFMLLPGETPSSMNRSSVAWDLLEPWNVRPDNAHLERHAVYTFRGQWATQWRKGRVLLAGDAAHLMPPFAGQGMCSGMRDAAALSWRLDAVLRGALPDSVLDSYSSERIGHVKEIIQFSIELGKVICITDPAIAAERDRQMLAAASAPDFKPQPPPQPRLGPGLFQPEAPGSGLLTPQAMVEFKGRTGLFDDVVGRGWVLLCRDQTALAPLSQAHLDSLESQAAIALALTGSGLRDVDGAYGAYLDSLGVAAVLIRPDFYCYGSARQAEQVSDLVDHWRESLGLARREALAIDS